MKDRKAKHKTVVFLPKSSSGLRRI